MVNAVRCYVSVHRWERKYFRYVFECWQDSQSFDFFVRCVVYSATIPYCCGEYIGESSVSLFNRIKTHIYATFGRGARPRGFQFRVLRRNVHQMIWTPPFMWDHHVSKRERMKYESTAIWERGARWNRTGERALGHTPAEDPPFVFAGRRKFTLVKRLRMWEKQKAMVTSSSK